MDIKTHIDYNIIFIGDPAVGKSTLINTFKNSHFKHRNYLETVGLNLVHDQIEFKNYIVDVTFWDTAGQNKYRRPTLNYLKFRRIDAVAIIYDLTRFRTLQSALNLVNYVQNLDRSMFTAIIGNKMDLLHDERLITQTIEEQNDFGKVYHFFVSAKTFNGIRGTIIDIIFQGLVLRMNKLNKEISISSVS